MLALCAKALNTGSVEALVCFACATVGARVEQWSSMYSSQIFRCFKSHAAVKHYSVESSLWKWLELDGGEAFCDNFHLLRFKERYASGDQEGGNPFQQCADLEAGQTEWQQRLLLPRAGLRPIPLLCCPEDVVRTPRCKHPDNLLCQHCHVPICSSCWHYSWSARHSHRIPMALANDNFWGYTSDIIARYKVRWIEAAIVSPCWTNMLIYYVEGDHGHLMTEELERQKFRTVVRGGCMSFQMPWEDILADLKQNCSDRSLGAVPHPQ